MSKVLHKCARIGCESYAKVKYCSRSCAAMVNNVLSPKRPARVVIKCLNCGCDFKTGRNTKGKFCSSICSGKYRSDSIVRAWLSGEISGGVPSSGELIRCIRNYLVDQADHRCTLCGWSVANPVTGKVILTIDHIDGDWKNNSPENLKVLCYNCHTLTPTFGSLNRGKNISNTRDVGSRRH